MNLPSRPIDKKISIHALLAESDLGNVVVVLRTWNFYPRSPCGERHHMPAVHVQLSIFLSTLSLRRATGVSMLCQKLIPSFLSTLSLRRATGFSRPLRAAKNYFYPRSPCGERHHQSTNRHQGQHFYPRSPCGERRSNGGNHYSYIRISIHALLAESDSHSKDIDQPEQTFLSTLSLRRATYVIRHAVNLHPNFYPRSPCGERPIFRA